MAVFAEASGRNQKKKKKGGPAMAVPLPLISCSEGRKKGGGKENDSQHCSPCGLEGEGEKEGAGGPASSSFTPSRSPWRRKGEEKGRGKSGHSAP